MNKKPYPKYKDSGVQWLGKVPEHWEVKRLKMAAQLSDHKVEADEENPLPYIGLENIESWTGKLLLIDPDVVPTGVANSFQEGRTLFGKLRPYLAKACNPDFSGLCSTELLVIEGRDFDRRALLYWLLADGFVNLVDSSTYGSKMPRANWDFIGNCRLPIPPLTEQTAIADFLDEQTGKIDRLIAKKRELIARLKEKRTALISRTVTRGLPPEVARVFGLEPHTRFKDSGVEWLGEIPEGWEALPLRRVVQSVKTGGTPDGADEHYFEEYGFKWFTPADFSEHLILEGSVRSLSETGKSAVKIFPPMAVLLVGIGATIGKVGLTLDVCSCNQQINAIVCNEQLSSFFLAYYLKTLREYIVKCGKFTTLPIINQDETKNLLICVPSIDEQSIIATYLDRETAKLDLLTEKVETAITRLQEYRTALITAAVTGKIDVRH
ncbi:MAG: restriction endonuclease subunit S [Magnetococcales bacterium]|nr:restriction endonuclease subunit S [Magnetococcales bacterium]